MLEINDNPSFDIYYSQEYISMTKKGEEDICPVDLYVKSRVIRDAVNLMRSKHYTSESLEPLDLEVDETFLLVRDLFMKLTSIKNKSTLTSQ